MNDKPTVRMSVRIAVGAAIAAAFLGMIAWGAWNGALG